MAVGTEVVAVRYEDIVAGTPISAPYPVYEALDIKVYYGSASLVAVHNTDYTITLGDDFDTFTLTPTASLIDKINALIAIDPTEQNYITVRRELDYLTDSTAAAARYTPFTSREFERTVLRFQQLQERLNRALVLSPNFVGDQPLLQLNEIQPGATLIVNAAGDAVEAGPEVSDINAQADRAENEADYAEEWAQSPSPISVEAGGDGATDQSSKTWAGISAASASASAASASASAASAASVNLPAISSGDAGKQLYVNETEDGYVLNEPSLVDGSVTEPKLADALKGKLVAFAANRTVLAAFDGATYQVVDLMETGLKGKFTPTNADISAEVAIDTEQAVYVAYSTDATGASGGWVRWFEGPVMARWCGGDLQAAINLAGLLNRDLNLGRKGDMHTVTSGVTIPDDMRVFSKYSGGYGAKISATGSNFTAVTLGDNVRLEGVEIEGPGNDAYNVASVGVFQTGTNNAPSAPTYANGPTLKKCHIHGFRNAGVELRYVDGFEIEKCLVENCGYHGILGVSVKNGLIHKTLVDDVSPGVSNGVGGFNAYGIALSKFSGDKVGYPKTNNVAVSHSEVRNVEVWHAFDTHGGDLVVFSDCVARNCKRGFIITAASDAAGGRYASKRSGFVRCHALDGLATHTEKGQAFWFVGAANTSGTYVDYAEDCFMQECFADGYGEDKAAGSGPVMSIEGVRRLRIDGITMINSVGRGILFGKDCLDFKIDGLTLSDIYSNYRSTLAIGFNGNNIKGRITNHELTNTGITPGSYRNDIGFYSASSLTGLQISISEGRNLSTTPTSYGTALAAYNA